MFLIVLLLVNIAIAGIIYLYVKLTIGICKCSKHLVDKVVIVTGGSNGIGFETAKDLADRGARVIIACENESYGTAAVSEIIAATGNSDVHYRYLDLASLNSVRKFANEILQREKRLDILVNNAGIYGSYNVKTEDGLLLGMQTNHFGPFLLTCLLLPMLKSTAPSRIINVSSMVHGRATLDLNNLNMENETKQTFSKNQVYAVSKLCNVLFTLELSRRLQGTGVTANSLHPGVVKTKILNDVDSKLFKIILPILKLFAKNQWEGAQTSIYLAVSPEVKEVSGKYFRDCHMANASTDQASDVVLARKLWDISEKLVKLI